MVRFPHARHAVTHSRFWQSYITTRTQIYGSLLYADVWDVGSSVSKAGNCMTMGSAHILIESISKTTSALVWFCFFHPWAPASLLSAYYLSQPCEVHIDWIKSKCYKIMQLSLKPKAHPVHTSCSQIASRYGWATGSSKPWSWCRTWLCHRTNKGFKMWWLEDPKFCNQHICWKWANLQPPNLCAKYQNARIREG